MAEVIVLPQQGNSVESVVLLDWSVAEGDTISEGDTICEVETDKATMEVEATASGTVLKILSNPGDEVAVKTPILVVGEPGESLDGLELGEDAHADSSADPAPDTRQAAPPASLSETVVQERPLDKSMSTAVSPRARRSAEQRGVDPAKVTGSGPGGRVIERDVLAAEIPATAAARADGNIWKTEGSGIGGRVTTADAAAPAPAAGRTIAAPTELLEEVPVAGVRKVIAERMHASLRDTAQLTLHSSADATALRALRARFKASDEAMGLQGVNLNDMVMYAVARTLLDFPALNAHFTGDTIRRFAGVDLGFAVDTAKGLLVPTLRGAHTMSLGHLSAAGKALATRAIEGKAGPDDLSPATFTVTNLGAFGVERFTPILNAPQVAILGVGGISLKAIETPQGVEHRPHIALSLTIDHQAVDGAPGARFLQALSARLAQFDLLLAL